MRAIVRDKKTRRRTVEGRLKPCPFCGGAARLDEERKEGWKFVVCLSCRAEVGEYTRFKVQVASMWNNRAAQPNASLPDLWEETTPGKVWARASKNVDGRNMGLKCELKLVGNKYRWMTLGPQKFGVGQTLAEAIEQVEDFIQQQQRQA